MSFDPLHLALIAAIFTIAGLAKGIVGFGLPTISLAAFALIGGLEQAMALLLLPSLITNVIQMLQGGRLKELSHRLGLFLIAAVLFIFVGALALGRVQSAALMALLGALILAYGITALLGLSLTGLRLERPVPSVLIGAVNGVLTGMTGSFVFPGALYLQGLGLTRDALVQSMGMLFTLSTLGLALALGLSGWLTVDLGWLSAIGIIPALLGMTLGQRIRHRLPETLFRKLFLIGLITLGVAILARAIL